MTPTRAILISGVIATLLSCDAARLAAQMHAPRSDVPAFQSQSTVMTSFTSEVRNEGGDAPWLLPATPYESDILSARPMRIHVGIALGGYALQHLGSFSPACNCSFEDGSAMRVLFGAEAGIHYPKLGIGARLFVGYLDGSHDFTRRSSRPSVIVGDDPDKMLDYESTSHVKLQYLTITPVFTVYFPYSSVFAFGGVEVGIPLTARYDHVERILTPGYAYADSSSTTTLLGDSDIPGGGSVRAAITVGLGGDVPLNDVFSVSVHGGIAYPLTTVSSQDDSWKLMTEYLRVVLRMRIR